jgi:glycosyltransferase involved in cell wall biosynthesis
MSPVEAMSFGIPMVTGFSRDIPDEFISGWNCLMTDDRGHRSALQIAAFAIQLRNDEALRKRIGSAGRDTVRRIFSKEKFRSSFKEIMS